MLGCVFDIKHFAVFDGPGIRTTLFLKGCPLRCLWCHNPEGLSEKPQIGFNKDRCINCGRCIHVCEKDAHIYDENSRHIFISEKCISCGKCVPVCKKNALTLYGQLMNTEYVVAELLKDKDFFDNSNGGITISGGECLLQADFCREVLIEMKAAGVHTAIDTCGFVDRKKIETVLPYTDLFLYDLKAIDNDIHIKCTGQANKIILENLRYIDSVNTPFEIRIPYVPGFNSKQVDKIGEFLQNCKNITKVRILSYHNYATTKYSSLGFKNTLPKEMPTDEEIEIAKNIIKSYGLKIAE